MPVVEPSPAALGGGGALRASRRLFLATRPMFFPASVLPVLLGTSWGYGLAGRLDGTAFVLALVAVVCVHAGANVLNDVYDEISGTDRINEARIHPFTGGSRFIQNGVLGLEQMRAWGWALLAAAAAAGVLLAAVEGLVVVLFGCAGVAAGVLYSLPPVQLAARGLGEATVGFGFGVLPVAGAAWLQSGRIDGGALLLSIPVACWVANILLINEVPDGAADDAAGKRTLAVRLGRQGTRRLYLAVNLVAALATLLCVGLGLLPLAAAAVPLALPILALRAAAAITAPPTAIAGGIRTTLAIHAAGCLWLAAWAWAG